MGAELERQRALEAAVRGLQIRNTAYRSYDGNEAFTFHGEPICRVIDYWRYRYAQLDSQHEVIAEYLVGKALGIEKAENLLSWTGYDLSYRSKRVEIKASAIVHPWHRVRVSKSCRFSIAPTSNYYWYGAADRKGRAVARQNELYVFCLNANRDVDRADPLNIDHWEFYVVPTFEIDRMCEGSGNPNQKTISLNVVRRLAGEAVKWDGLRAVVDRTIDGIDRHIEALDEQNPPSD